MAGETVPVCSCAVSVLVYFPCVASVSPWKVRQCERVCCQCVTMEGEALRACVLPVCHHGGWQCVRVCVTGVECVGGVLPMLWWQCGLGLVCSVLCNIATSLTRSSPHVCVCGCIVPNCANKYTHLPPTLVATTVRDASAPCAADQLPRRGTTTMTTKRKSTQRRSAPSRVSETYAKRGAVNGTRVLIITTPTMRRRQSACLCFTRRAVVRGPSQQCRPLVPLCGSASLRFQKRLKRWRLQSPMRANLAHLERMATACWKTA